MGIAVEALFTSALGLQPPWVVDDVRLDTAKRRIDFEIGCHTSRLACPASRWPWLRLSNTTTSYPAWASRSTM